MVVIVEALDGRVLDGAVHALDLTIGSEMFRPGRAMIDAGLRTGIFEGPRPEEFTFPPFAMASRMSGTADPPAPGVVNWMPLSVKTVCTL